MYDTVAVDIRQTGRDRWTCHVMKCSRLITRIYRFHYMNPALYRSFQKNEVSSNVFQLNWGCQEHAGCCATCFIVISISWNSQVSYKRELQGAIPANPKKCWEKKVKFTPKNIILNRIFNQFGFIEFLYNNNYKISNCNIY